MTGHVQSASGKFLVRPVIVLTAICFPVRVQVEAAQSAKYPWQNRKSGRASAAPPGRAIGGANARSMEATPNTTFASRFPCVARGDPPISLKGKLVAEFLLVVKKISQLVGSPASGIMHSVAAAALASVRSARPRRSSPSRRKDRLPPCEAAPLEKHGDAV